MVNTTRLMAMIHLAEFESKDGKALETHKYYRSDYIALDMIKTFFLTTIAYVLILFLLVASNLEFLLDDIDRMDIRVLVSEIIIGYILMLGVYLTISFFRADARYRNARRDVRDYEAGLKHLEKLYRRKSS